MTGPTGTNVNDIAVGWLRDNTEERTPFGVRSSYA